MNIKKSIAVLVMLVFMSVSLVPLTVFAGGTHQERSYKEKVLKKHMHRHAKRKIHKRRHPRKHVRRHIRKHYINSRHLD